MLSLDFLQMGIIILPYHDSPGNITEVFCGYSKIEQLLQKEAPCNNVPPQYFQCPTTSKLKLLQISSVNFTVYVAQPSLFINHMKLHITHRSSNCVHIFKLYWSNFKTWMRMVNWKFIRYDIWIVDILFNRIVSIDYSRHVFNIYFVCKIFH